MQKFNRRWHRRLGPILGIQFFFWTLGGIYFSWFDLDDVHGDWERTEVATPDLLGLTGTRPLESFLHESDLAQIEEIRYGMFLERPVVRLYQDVDHVEMYDAVAGDRLSPISEDQARRVAETDFAPPGSIVRVEWIEAKGGEYKNGVPAWRIDFDNRKRTHLYVHAGTGLVTARRNSVWRGFDFLWMFHILDFQEREDFNNWLLRIVSVLGMVTVLSGYLLWGLTTPWFRPRR